jgi:peptidoglycan/LPS O-acetylase OafA/YrhL
VTGLLLGVPPRRRVRGWSKPRQAGRLQGLDGLRGVAVTTVVGFHLGITGIRGGVLGVDIFFVLSGFLITGLLLAEWRAGGRISLRRFSVRRARRLLPALLLVLAHGRGRRAHPGRAGGDAVGSW